MKKFLLLCLLLMFTAIPAFATPITTLFGTGLDSNGNQLALGSSDSHYTVLGNDAEVRTTLPGTYLPNDANSQWIWENDNGQPTNVTRTFRTTFDLTGFDSTTAVINGSWGADNQGVDILINGQSTGIDLLGVIVGNFSELHDFTINSGFVAGLNTLDFVIQDDGVTSAFRAELTGTAAPVPEPATMMLFGIGLLGLAGVSRRKK